MGAIISLFENGKDGERIVIDFENVTPSENEMQLWTTVNEVLKKAAEVIKEIEQFKGNDQLIRQAITNPTQENEVKVWNAVGPQALQLHGWYEYATELGLFYFFPSFRLN